MIFIVLLSLLLIIPQALGDCSWTCEDAYTSNRARTPAMLEVNSQPSIIHHDQEFLRETVYTGAAWSTSTIDTISEGDDFSDIAYAWINGVRTIVAIANSSIDDLYIYTYSAGWSLSLIHI